MKHLILSICATVFTMSVYAQKIDIPSSYSNLGYEGDKLYFEKDGTKYFAKTEQPTYSIEKLLGQPKGTENGIELNFQNFVGTITYGLIPYNQVDHPLPIYRFTKNIDQAPIQIDIKHDFRYPYDFVGWKDNEKLTIGYRLSDKGGNLVFDGEISVIGKGPFDIVPSVLEGPFVNKLEEDKVTIWFKTTLPVPTSIDIEGRTFYGNPVTNFHEFDVDGLQPNTKYQYTIHYGDFEQTYTCQTALTKGSNEAFVFAYASDSRHASGGGERRVYGANAYIMKKIGALAHQQKASFVQFTGDLINGYLNSKEEIQVQYSNWKKAVEPFWHYIPFNVTMGNHEALGYIFEDEKGKQKGFVDKFPYETASAESAFKDEFVNPNNGPDSEDNGPLDPNVQKVDFPSYAENVYYYTYGNVAMIVLNSDYWYAPTIKSETSTSGGLHGYILDNQLEWLRNTINTLENDEDIQHIFVTQHTPAFPNGGHSGDDMWYSGDNSKRPYIAGKPVAKGIIERRDEYLDILINQSSKVIAILTGDEHNYNYMKLTDEVTIYPENYPHEKLHISRPIYQINNGAAGAPYYAQEVLPWSEHTKSFSVENALCLFYVRGQSIIMKVINPDTLNEIDLLKLR